MRRPRRPRDPDARANLAREMDLLTLVEAIEADPKPSPRTRLKKELMRRADCLAWCEIEPGLAARISRLVVECGLGSMSTGGKLYRMTLGDPNEKREKRRKDAARG